MLNFGIFHRRDRHRFRFEAIGPSHHFLAAFQVLGLERQTALQAGLWRRQYSPSLGTGLADALIAAVAQAAGGTLVTLNRRHFPMLTHVLVPYSEDSR